MNCLTYILVNAPKRYYKKKKVKIFSNINNFSNIYIFILLEQWGNEEKEEREAREIIFREIHNYFGYFLCGQFDKENGFFYYMVSDKNYFSK